jgi:hypothetical protein
MFIFMVMFMFRLHVHAALICSVDMQCEDTDMKHGNTT